MMAVFSVIGLDDIRSLFLAASAGRSLAVSGNAGSGIVRYLVSETCRFRGIRLESTRRFRALWPDAVRRLQGMLRLAGSPATVLGTLAARVPHVAAIHLCDILQYLLKFFFIGQLALKLYALLGV